VVTLASGGRVTVAPVLTGSGAAYQWEAKAGWYAGNASYALSPPSPTPQTSPARTRALYGPPARVYVVDGWTIQVWHRNLLSRVRRVTATVPR
jgi:hypothetical protein